MADEWLGPNPFYLVISVPGPRGSVVIDLDKAGWAKENADLMREEAIWNLQLKETYRPVAVLIVRAGEQPYYTQRHVGYAKLPEGNEGEISAYGLGKKRLDGHVDRIWILPGGVVCTGDDVDDLGLTLVRQGITTAKMEVVESGNEASGGDGGSGDVRQRPRSRSNRSGGKGRQRVAQGGASIKGHAGQG